MMPTPHAYPAYKPSGVPWLGDVREHWEVARSRVWVRTSNHQVLMAWA